MNARGSTEIIVASIGLSMGALNEPLFTAIVAMAVVTTMAMPPMLRWALATPAHERRRAGAARARGAGGARLSRAAGAAAGGRRCQPAADELASQLAGLAGGRAAHPDHGAAPGRVARAVAGADKTPAERTTAAARAGAATGDERAAKDAAEAVGHHARSRRRRCIRARHCQRVAEGLRPDADRTRARYADGAFDPQITRSAARFGGAFAIADGARRAARGNRARAAAHPAAGKRHARPRARRPSSPSPWHRPRAAR